MEFIIVSLQSWDSEIGSNCINIAKEISKRHKVLYINRPIDRYTLIKQRNEKKFRSLRKIINGKKNPFKIVNERLIVYTPKTIVESVNFIRSKGIHRKLLYYNNRKLSNDILFAMQEVGFSKPIVFNDNDFINYFFIKKFIPNQAVIYYLRDNLTYGGYFSLHGYLESEFMAKADIVFTNSIYLQQLALKNNSNSHFVGQGCEYIDDVPISNRSVKIVENIDSPLIGYIGALTAKRLDIKLLLFLLEEMPAYNFVFVGPYDDTFPLNKLNTFNNFHYLGKIAPELVFQYIKAFDVCINPQTLNLETIGNYPRKIDEYLLLGKPVVATQTQAMEYFKKHTYLAKNHNNFRDLIIEAFSKDNKDKQNERISFAKEHTWENSVKIMYDIINNL